MCEGGCTFTANFDLALFSTTWAVCFSGIFFKLGISNSAFSGGGNLLPLKSLTSGSGTGSGSAFGFLSCSRKRGKVGKSLNYVCDHFR